MQLFGTKGQKFLHCPGTKGQAKNLAKGQAGMRDKMGRSRKGRSKTGKGCPRIFAPALVPGQRDTVFSNLFKLKCDFMTL